MRARLGGRPLHCFMWPSGRSNTFQSVGAQPRGCGLSEVEEVVLNTADGEQVIVWLDLIAGE